MTDLIMQLAGVIQHDMDTLREVAQNVANANTPGYKAARSFNALTLDMNKASGPVGGMAAIERQAALRQESGGLQQTGRLTDLALSGDAWFVVQTDSGEQLTRDGRFRLDTQGRLITQSGLFVLGQSGVIEVGPGVLTVDSAGQLKVDNEEVAQLKLVRFSDKSQIHVVGGGRYTTIAPLLPASNYMVYQGWLERSNAELGADMVKIMEASRHVESMQRALSAYDSLLNSGINQLGKD
ncbi:MAG: flagellar hook basal-body protein [Moraxellaceae bacterium]|nr:flagellar hook basal-body protein [Moraxellaceae bacterium]MDZ4385692.1 flagellar hook basal-body protein [Moraxellaceae bacterium]